MPTVDQIMERMGFPETERGPYVTGLRAVVARQISEGMMNRSAGTWAPECYDKDGNWTISHEERAKAMLAADWAIQNAHSFEVKAFDPPIRLTFNTKTMRRGIRVRWGSLIPWLGDRWREWMMMLRVWRDRYVLRKLNPYTTDR